MERREGDRLAVLFSSKPTSKADPISQPAPGKGKFGCWGLGSQGGLMLQTFFHGAGRSSLLADKSLLGQELQQVADGRADQMVVHLEPPHMGAPAALVL